MRLSLFTFFVVFIFQYCYSQDTLRWSPSSKLAWQDFKGEPDSLSGHGAISDVQIKYSFSNKDSKLTYSIFCFFNKEDSWVKDSSAEGLIHEQGHFDIGEIFARKFRKESKTYKFIPAIMNDQFKNIANQIKEEEAAMDAQYDKETDFHRDSANQIRWNKKIANELDLLKEYSK